jgi:hypothetical protein
MRIVAARGEPSHRKMTSHAETSERQNGDTPIRYSRRTALRREQCDIWTVSRERNGKCVTTERLILGSRLVMEHSFRGYGE